MGHYGVQKRDQVLHFLGRLTNVRLGCKSTDKNFSLLCRSVTRFVAERPFHPSQIIVTKSRVEHLSGILL